MILQHAGASPSYAGSEGSSRGSLDGGVGALREAAGPAAYISLLYKESKGHESSTLSEMVTAKSAVPFCGRRLFRCWCHLCFVIPALKDTHMQSLDKQRKRSAVEW